MEKNKKNSSLKLFFYKEKVGKLKKNNNLKFDKENLIGKIFKKKDEEVYCFFYSEEIESLTGNSLNFEDFETEELELEFPEIYELQKKYINSFFFSNLNPSNLYEDYLECEKKDGLNILKNINLFEDLVFFIQKNNLIYEFSRAISFYFSDENLEEKKNLFLKIFSISKDFNFTKKLCELTFL